MGTLIVALNDQLRYTIEGPLADRISADVLREFGGRAGLVFAHEVLAAIGSELREDPRYHQLVDVLDEPDDDSLMVDVSWQP
jgi:hypothetical protein